MSKESKEKKAQIIEALGETFAKCSVGVLTDYRGLTVTEITSLRRKLREAGIEYKVVKNTLARLAAAKADREDLAESFMGPVVRVGWRCPSGGASWRTGCSASRM